MVFKFNFRDFKIIGFFFIFDKEIVNVNFEKFLNSILSHNSDFGLILLFNKNDVYFSNLKFLINLIKEFYYKNKFMGIWGLPECVLRHIIHYDYDFLKIYDYLIKEDSFSISQIFGFKNFLRSQQLVGCKRCRVFDKCQGLGLLRENQYQWNYRISSEERYNLWRNVSFVDGNLESKYEKTLNYMKSWDLLYTDRCVKFAKLYSNKEDYSERFTYFCRSLYKNEVKTEFDFLRSILRNKDFLNEVENELYAKSLMISFAFSITESISDRESYYLYFFSEDTLIDYLYKKKNLNIEKFDFEKLDYLSFDFISNVGKDFKVYSQINDFDKFAKYLIREFNFNTAILDDCYDFYLVRRFDEDFKLKSIKIEFMPKDLGKTLSLMEKIYSRSFEYDKEKYILESIAIDFSKKGEVNKFTFYLGININL